MRPPLAVTALHAPRRSLLLSQLAAGVKGPCGLLAASQGAGSTAGASHHLFSQKKALLSQYADVLNAEGRLPPSTHGVDIVTYGRPVTTKFRWLDTAKLQAAKEEFRHLEQEGIVRRSNSDWASPLHTVQKSDGSWWPCGDFCRLNLLSEANCTSVPAPQHGRYHWQSGRSNSLQQTGFEERLSPDSHSS